MCKYTTMKKADAPVEADEPAPIHVAHDVFHRRKRFGGRRFVVHRQENAGDELIHQNQQRERSEVVPEVEILRRVVFGDLAAPHRGQRKALIDPSQNTSRGNRLGFRHGHG
jgi:hypothetical protein